MSLPRLQLHGFAIPFALAIALSVPGRLSARAATQFDVCGPAFSGTLPLKINEALELDEELASIPEYVELNRKVSENYRGLTVEQREALHIRAFRFTLALILPALLEEVRIGSLRAANDHSWYTDHFSNFSEGFLFLNFFHHLFSVKYPAHPYRVQAVMVAIGIVGNVAFETNSWFPYARGLDGGDLMAGGIGILAYLVWVNALESKPGNWMVTRASRLSGQVVNRARELRARLRSKSDARVVP